MQAFIAFIRKSFFSAQAASAAPVRVLGAADLRQVAGGVSSSPRTGW